MTDMTKNKRPRWRRLDWLVAKHPRWLSPPVWGLLVGAVLGALYLAILYPLGTLWWFGSLYVTLCDFLQGGTPVRCAIGWTIGLGVPGVLSLFGLALPFLGLRQGVIHQRTNA